MKEIAFWLIIGFTVLNEEIGRYQTSADKHTQDGKLVIILLLKRCYQFLDYGGWNLGFFLGSQNGMYHYQCSMTE